MEEVYCNGMTQSTAATFFWSYPLQMEKHESNQSELEKDSGIF